MPIMDRRILGKTTQFPVSGSGGGGGGNLTIQSNVDGNMLRATGGASTISGIGDFKFVDSSFEVTTDFYIKSAGNNLLILRV